MHVLALVSSFDSKTERFVETNGDFLLIWIQFNPGMDK